MFTDRRDAGRRLAERLESLLGQDVVVVGLPRGGVPVAFEVAARLGAPLDVIVVRKLGVPFQPELAMGALGEDGVRVVDPRVLAAAGVTAEDLAAIEEREREVLERRCARWRREAPAVPLAGRVVVIVDDGIATGSTASAACRVARARGASRVVLATPVAPAPTVRRLRADADEVIALTSPRRFGSVGQWYTDFTPTDDDEVTELPARAASPS